VKNQFTGNGNENELLENIGELETLLNFALDTKLGFDAQEVIQKYFMESDLIVLEDANLQQELRNGSSQEVERAREDILGRLSVLHEEWLKILFESGTLQDKSANDNVFTGFKTDSSAAKKRCIIM